jgi:hypothetical protein
MNAHDDVARFFADDDPRLVAASFACPVCLGLDATARLVLDHEDSEVECSCAACATAWSVGVTPAQALRLVLDPPPTATDAPLRMLPTRTADAPWSRSSAA